MKVKVLGSVSPFSHKDKNGIGYFVYNEKSKVLLDLGSGISRLFDMEKDLEDLVIIISHLHKDHYNEIFSFAYASYVYHKHGKLKNRVKVYIPDEDINDNDYKFFKNFGDENYLEFITYNENTELSVGDFTITFKESLHGKKTYMTKIKENDKTLVYTSDTGYGNKNINDFAYLTELLICESTFLTNESEKGDKHLNASEAALIAKEAKVKKLMLTHFWPTQNKNAYVNEARNIFENTIAAVEDEIIEII